MKTSRTKNIMLILGYLSFNGICGTENESVQKHARHVKWMTKVVKNVIDFKNTAPAIEYANQCLSGIIKQEGTAHLVMALCNAGIDSNFKDTFAEPDKGNTPLHTLFTYRPKDLKVKTALLLLAGADLEIKDAFGNKPLARLEDGPPELVTAVEKIKAAVPYVKQEREENRDQTLSLLKSFVSQGPASIIDQYSFEPVWEETCWPLFEKHMAQQSPR